MIFLCCENVNVATCLCFFPCSLQRHLCFFLLLVAQKPQHNGVLVCTLCSIFARVCFDLLCSAKELVVGVKNVCNHFVKGTMNLSRVKLCQELSSLQAVYISLIRNSAYSGSTYPKVAATSVVSHESLNHPEVQLDPTQKDVH